MSPQQALEGVRGQWASENWLYGVRDVSFSEDRLPRKSIVPRPSVTPNLALNLLRALGERFVVDGCRALSGIPDRGFSLLISHRS